MPGRDAFIAAARERRNTGLGLIRPAAPARGDTVPLTTMPMPEQGERLAADSLLPPARPLPPIGPMAPRRVKPGVPWRALAISGWALVALLALAVAV